MNDKTNPYGHPDPITVAIETPFGKLGGSVNGPHSYTQYGREYNLACSIRCETLRDEPFVINGRSYHDGFTRESFNLELHQGGAITVDFGMNGFTDAAKEKIRQHFADGALFTPILVAEATYRGATLRASSAWYQVNKLTEELTDAKILLTAAHGEYTRAGQELEKVEGEP